MTTNQTIDGVPLLPCPFCGGEPYGTHDHYVHDDLSPMPCVECRSCSAHLKVEDWNRRVQPSAQPQGGPILIQAVAITRQNDDGMYLEWLLEGGISEMEFPGQVLFAMPEANDLCDEDGSAEIYIRPVEQPAPVAVVMPERMGHSTRGNGWNACLDELKRLNPSL